MNTTVLALQEEQVLVAVGKSGAQPCGVKSRLVHSHYANGGKVPVKILYIALRIRVHTLVHELCYYAAFNFE